MLVAAGLLFCFWAPTRRFLNILWATPKDFNTLFSSLEIPNHTQNKIHMYLFLSGNELISTPLLEWCHPWEEIERSLHHLNPEPLRWRQMCPGAAPVSSDDRGGP